MDLCAARNGAGFVTAGHSTTGQKMKRKEEQNKKERLKKVLSFSLQSKKRKKPIFFFPFFTAFNRISCFLLFNNKKVGFIKIGKQGRHKRAKHRNSECGDD